DAAAPPAPARRRKYGHAHEQAGHSGAILWPTPPRRGGARPDRGGGRGPAPAARGGLPARSAAPRPRRRPRPRRAGPLRRGRPGRNAGLVRRLCRAELNLVPPPRAAPPDPLRRTPTMPLEPRVKRTWEELQKKFSYPVNAIGLRINEKD